MKELFSATAGLFRGALRWRGRLSKEGYWNGWLGVLVVNLILYGLLRFLAALEVEASLPLYALGLWNLAALVPLLSAGVRRYHDLGRSGRVAVLLFLLARLCLLPGLVVGLITLLFFFFSAGAEVNMEGFLMLMGVSALLLLVGAVCCVLHILLLLRPGDPGENAYGPPDRPSPR